MAKEMGSESIREAMLNNGTETQDVGDGKNNCNNDYNSRIYSLSPRYWPKHVFFFFNKTRLFLVFSLSPNVNDFNLCLGIILTTDLKLMFISFSNLFIFN